MLFGMHSSTHCSRIQILPYLWQSPCSPNRDSPRRLFLASKDQTLKTSDGSERQYIRSKSYELRSRICGGWNNTPGVFIWHNNNFLFIQKFERSKFSERWALINNAEAAGRGIRKMYEFYTNLFILYVCISNTWHGIKMACILFMAPMTE